MAADHPTDARDSERLSHWQTRLDSVPELSPRYRERYAIVLAALAQDAAPSIDSTAAEALEAGDPMFAARVLAGTATSTRTDGFHTRSRPPTELDLDSVVELIHQEATRNGGISHLLLRQRALEQTAVPLHPSRQARAITVAGKSFVALRWRGDSVATRHANRCAMEAVLAAAAAVAPTGLQTQADHVVVDIDDGDPWVVSPNLGTTLEDRLRSDEFAPGERFRVIQSLRALREAMIERGVIWQGFAPRNMFFVEEAIVLIDFEQVVRVTDDPVQAAAYLLWHRVFFADSLTSSEHDRVFAPTAGEPTVDPNYEVAADDFERALLGTSTVSWRQRRDLLHASRVLEGRHARPAATRDGGVLFGHELGHYWGDFLSATDEARLFSLLQPINDPARLVACLEVFEAAMEADICDEIRARATEIAAPGARHTIGVIEALERAGSTRLAAKRGDIGDWYARLGSNPAWLIDDLLHRVGTDSQGLDLATLDAYFVGNAAARAQHEEALATAAQMGLDFLHRDETFLHYRDADALLATAAGPLPLKGRALPEVLATLEERIVRYSVSQSHRRYLAFPDAGNAVAAVIGGTVARLLNQNLIAVDRSAPSATFVEIQVVEWLRELIGYASSSIEELRGVRDVAGLWATGGHLANHLAMLVALGRRFPHVRKRGLMELGTRPTVVMAGPIAHYSHSDAAFHLGLGWDSVTAVGAEPGFTTDPAAVETALKCPSDGTTPFMVVGVAGNCRTTGLDDLGALADVCEEHGVWFHVDACHGGSLIFNDRLREQYLRGINRADSVSLDPHKGLFTPYPSSYVVFRDRGVLTQFSRHEATVMEDGCWDLGLITPFLGSRGFESLGTWMLLQHIGVRQLGAIVESRLSHVRYLQGRIDDSGLFVRLNDVDFYRFAFVFCPAPAQRFVRSLPPKLRAQAARIISAHTSSLNTALYQAGEVCFDEHTLADLGDRVGAGAGASYTIMAACPGNALLTRQHLDDAVARLLRFARMQTESLMTDLTAITGEMPITRLPIAGPAGWNDL